MCERPAPGNFWPIAQTAPSQSVPKLSFPRDRQMSLCCRSVSTPVGVGNSSVQLRVGAPGDPEHQLRTHRLEFYRERPGTRLDTVREEHQICRITQVRDRSEDSGDEADETEGRSTHTVPNNLYLKTFPISVDLTSVLHICRMNE